MMRKFTVAVLIGFLTTSLLIACSSDDGSEKNKEGAEIVVSAAASLTDAAEEIKTEFNKKNPHITVSYNFGGSGKLSQQIQQGAPADVFMSASKLDVDFLAEKDLIVEGSRFDFASNEIVVITHKSEDIKISRLEDLITLEIDNIIFGDVESVPLGRYAKEALDNVGIWNELESKMVFGSAVNQILTHVEEGNGKIGFVYNTDAMRSDDVKIILHVNPSLHAPIIYPAAAVANSSNLDAAQTYLDFLKGDEVKAILESHGFIVD